MARKPAPQKRPANQAEAKFYDLAGEGGWRVMKRGWPDFFCLRTTPEGEVELALVEVKPKRGRRLKSQQRLILETLAKMYGVPCYQWDPEDGWQAIPPF